MFARRPSCTKYRARVSWVRCGPRVDIGGDLVGERGRSLDIAGLGAVGPTNMLRARTRRHLEHPARDIFAARRARTANTSGAPPGARGNARRDLSPRTYEKKSLLFREVGNK